MTEPLDYMDFVTKKINVATQSGFDLEGFKFHTSNKPHQSVIVRRVIQDGKTLVAAAFGLGKTQIGLEVARAVFEHTGKKVLFVADLGVRHQFVNRDGPRLGMHLQYCATDAEIEAAETQYIITNYERVRDDTNIHPQLHDFGAVIFEPLSPIYDPATQQGL